MATLNIDSANEIKAESDNWVPLEANADVFNDWAHKLGLAECEQFVDVFGLDDDLLSMVPQPVKALLLLFPVSKNYENERHAQAADIAHNGQAELDNTLVFFPQKVPNACGTMALLHAMANSPVTVTPGSDLARLFENAANQNSEERAQAVVDASFLRTAHASSAQAGQTEAPNANDDVDLHFVTFVLAPAAVSEGARLIELDGRKVSPIDHGSSQDLLKDASAVVKEKFMKHDPGNINFALIALTTQEDY
ncbi:hypothetical protein E3Q23_03298 [Wallemia mellicola]|uniref:Ubiquitin carboxyl-terminal hydrolase n=1 Tax=Wallemia mellicola TaxID=1708541 RepID=A0A4T0TMV0_9BASI|nr:hypothetical protein E3Q23_03298 [Wallemia mellicola]TIC66359.1 peptidase C12, ubiquitin carboxyl-terminal hydrolase 1 [Wallemia mellicola]